jgi:hypothetical protein
VNRSAIRQGNDVDWTAVLDIERQLEARIADEKARAQGRVQAARAAAAAAEVDPQALAQQAALREQHALQAQRSLIDGITARADAAAAALRAVPEATVDALARRAVDAVLAELLAAGPR